MLNDARAANHPTVDGLKSGLRDLGFEEGRDVVFDVRLTDADPARIPAAADALVKARVDAIFTSGETATLAARAATQTIPIVFTLVGDPVAAGFVKSHANPGGNVTGVSSLATDLVGKRLEALTSLAPNVRRVWAIHSDAGPAFDAAIARANQVSSRGGLQVVSRAVLTKGELGWSATRYAQGGVAAALVEDDDSPELHGSDTLAAGGGLLRRALGRPRRARLLRRRLSRAGCPMPRDSWRNPSRFAAAGSPSRAPRTSFWPST